MPDVNQDFTVYAGDNNTLNFTLTDSNGDALDITGASADWRLSSIYDPAHHLIIKNSSDVSQISITNAVGGLLSVFLIPADTSALGDRPYTHQLKIVDSSSNVIHVTVGTAYVYYSIV